MEIGRRGFLGGIGALVAGLALGGSKKAAKTEPVVTTPAGQKIPESYFPPNDGKTFRYVRDSEVAEYEAKGYRRYGHPYPGKPAQVVVVGIGSISAIDPTTEYDLVLVGPAGRRDWDVT